MRTPARKNYTPGEFSAALETRGVIRSVRWVQDQCAAGRIRTLPLPGRYEIPPTELDRLTQTETTPAQKIPA